MLAIPGSVHIGSARSTRSAIQIPACHLESAVFISYNLEPWRLGEIALSCGGDVWEIQLQSHGPAGRAQLATEMSVEPGLAAKR